MRRIALATVFLAALTATSFAQTMPPPLQPEAKPNANPCTDEVAASLQKLRDSSWFHMETKMVTANGPSTMEIDYVLPDRMHQKVTTELTKKTSELILVGKKAWSRQGDAPWHELAHRFAGELWEQMQDNVVEQQKNVGNYTCKGRTKFDDREVFSYKLETETEKGSSLDPKKQPYRMFYIDAMTGLPAGNVLLVPDHEKTPVFSTTYTYPADIKVEPPKDVAEAPPVTPSMGDPNEKTPDKKAPDKSDDQSK
jgi:hypothetical protein